MADLPKLRCPICGYEYQPTMHGWAFMTDKNTKCEGNPGEAPRKRESFRHPFEVVS